MTSFWFDEGSVCSFTQLGDMMLHRLFFLACLYCLTATTALCATPKLLGGTWEDAENNEHGGMTIVVDKENGVHIAGVIHLTGSLDCTQPIPFRGIRSKQGIDVIADTPGICGYNGTLRAAAKISSQKNSEGEYYIGNFSYTLFGGVWRKGTFRVRTLEHTPK